MSEHPTVMDLVWITIFIIELVILINPGLIILFDIWLVDVMRVVQ